MVFETEKEFEEAIENLGLDHDENIKGKMFSLQED